MSIYLTDIWTHTLCHYLASLHWSLKDSQAFHAQTEHTVFFPNHAGCPSSVNGTHIHQSVWQTYLKGVLGSHLTLPFSSPASSPLRLAQHHCTFPLWTPLAIALTYITGRLSPWCQGMASPYLACMHPPISAPRSDTQTLLFLRVPSQTLLTRSTSSSTWWAHSSFPFSRYD